MVDESSSIPGDQKNVRFYADVLLRTLVLLIVFNLFYAALTPGPLLARISAYNSLFPGRTRLPYGENPEREYNMSLSSLEAMFASHEISGKPKSPSEFRVLMIGDSSIWGFLLPPGKTLAAYINEAQVVLPDGRAVHAYNLGYPVMSLAKDLLILNEAMAYEPDLIIWPVTLESFPEDKQLSHPLLQQNPAKVQALSDKYSIDFGMQSPEQIEASFWNDSIIGSRRSLADLLRLQLYGVMWAATGIDHEIPETYTPRQEDLPADTTFHNLPGPYFAKNDLAFDLLSAGQRIAGQVPVILVNEPMFISQGMNSHIRYNFFYPRWAYDDYRQHLESLSRENGWNYLDLWDAVDNHQFTNSAIHMTPEGTRQFAHSLIESIIELAGSTAPETEN